MSPTWIALAAVALAVALGAALRRRAATRRAACRREMARLLADRRPGLTVRPGEGRAWRLARNGDRLATLDGGALTRAAAGDAARRRRIFLAVADAAVAGPRPFAGRFDLKEQGARVLPRLADEGLELLHLDPPPVRFTAAGSAGLPTIYLLADEPRPAYLGDEHLAAAGIDARDVHGVALAVLRQRFDEDEARRALDGGGPVRIEPADGCGGSRLLLLSEILGDGETLFAAAPGPALLLVAAERAALEEALGRIDEPVPPLPPAVLRVTAGQLTREV